MRGNSLGRVSTRALTALCTAVIVNHPIASRTAAAENGGTAVLLFGVLGWRLAGAAVGAELGKPERAPEECLIVSS